MTTKATLSTKGFEDYLEAIVKAGQNVDAVADEALLAGAQVMQEGMQEKCPVDTGNLQEHIVIDGPHQDGNYHSAQIGVIGADADTARYGNAVEYGTAHKPARSYIRAGFAKAKRAAQQAMAEVLKGKGVV